MSRNRIALFVLIACVLGALPFGAGAQTLKIAAVVPDGTAWMREMRNSAKEISDRTEGRVRFKFYPGGVMGNDKGVLRKIRIGQLHGGAMTASGLTAIYRDAVIYNLPFLFWSYAEVDYVRKHMDPLIIDALRERGFISFGLVEAGFSYFMSRRPIRTLDELRKRKVWVPDDEEVGRTVFKALDVFPVPLPLTDVLTALQTGLVDTVPNSPVGHITFQWHRRVKYFTDVPLIYLYGSLVIQRRAFERLRSEDQAVVREVLAASSGRIDRRNREANHRARMALRRQGIVFVKPTEEELQKWNNVIAVSVGGLSRKGIFSAEILTTLQGHLDDYRRIALKSK